jgi:hypothetical protein
VANSTVKKRKEEKKKRRGKKKTVKRTSQDMKATHDTTSRK